MKALIAAVDDDPEFLKLLSILFEGAGHKVRTFETAGRFLDAVARDNPALCFIDVHLAGIDGRDLIRILRSNPETKRTPIIAVSATAVSPRDAVRGLEEGADEYLRKPIDLDLTLARVAGLLARSGAATPPEATTLSWRGVILFPEEHRATVDDRDVVLTRLEFELLSAFLRQPNRVLARTWLLQNVWDSPPEMATRTVDKHVESVRRKLGSYGSSLETVFGVGYILRA